MRFLNLCIVLAMLAVAAPAETAAQTEPETKSVTVPITFDQNRVTIDVDLPLPDGSTKRVRGWVDTGDPQLQISQHAAKLMGLAITCDAQQCSAPPPPEIMIGAMKIPLGALQEAKIPLRPERPDSVMVAGMSAEIKIPSTILRSYDVLISFPDREFKIGLPGSLAFKGVKSKMLVNPKTGFLEIPSKIENKSYSLGLDVGSSISFLSEELFARLATARPDWPHMTGAVGPANLGELGDDETKWKLMRVDRVQFGPLYLTDVAVAEFPKTFSAFFEKDADRAIAGLIGANALLNYRIGLDYAHSSAYFDIGNTFKFPAFDVVGLILRPDDNTRFTILGVADFEGKPSVLVGEDGVQPGDHLVAVDGIPAADSTMGQVWSLLEGSIGQERKLTIERGGKQFRVSARVQHFLGEAEENQSQRKSGRK
jgi:hypothetical protein